jgi:hypothetical protein
MATLLDGERVVTRSATWSDVEAAVSSYFAGDGWLYFELRLGDFERQGFMILSSKTRNSHLFAVLVTFDGRTYHSPVPRPEEGMLGTYGSASEGVFPDDRCVSYRRAMRAAKTFLESGQLDPAEEWLAYSGTGYAPPRAG